MTLIYVNITQCDILPFPVLRGKQIILAPDMGPETKRRKQA